MERVAVSRTHSSKHWIEPILLFGLQRHSMSFSQSMPLRPPVLRQPHGRKL
jgi:hypothetical protein